MFVLDGADQARLAEAWGVFGEYEGAERGFFPQIEFVKVGKHAKPTAWGRRHTTGTLFISLRGDAADSGVRTMIGKPEGGGGGLVGGER